MHRRSFLSALSLVAALSPASARAETPSGAAPAAGEVRGPRVSLSVAVQRALAHNPSAAAALDEVHRSEALVRQARAASLPTLTANGAYTRLDSERRSAGTVVAGLDQLGANVTLAVPLFAPKAWAQTTHAGDNAEITRLGADDVRRRLAAAVGHAYLTVVVERRTIEVNERARDTARAHLEFAQTRLDGGAGTRLDVIRAAQEVASSAAQVEASQAGMVRAQEALAVLMGADGPVDVEDDIDLSEPSSSSESVDDVRARRPDVLSLEGRVSAAKRIEDDAWTDYAPALTAVATPFYQTPATPLAPQWGWQAQLLLTIPLYDGGLRYGLAAERKAATNAARNNLDGAVRQVASDLRGSREALRRAVLSQQAAREAATLAADALTLATIAYRAGATTNLEVIDAERRARDAATTATIAEDGARQARLELLIASGRFPAR